MYVCIVSDIYACTEHIWYIYIHVVNGTSFRTLTITYFLRIISTDAESAI